MADQVPAQPGIGRLRDLLQGLLDFVFAEIAAGRRRPRRERRRWDGSWKRRSGGRRRDAARAPGRVRDARADLGQPLGICSYSF